LEERDVFAKCIYTCGIAGRNQISQLKVDGMELGERKISIGGGEKVTRNSSSMEKNSLLLLAQDRKIISVMPGQPNLRSQLSIALLPVSLM